MNSNYMDFIDFEENDVKSLMAPVGKLIDQLEKILHKK